MRKLSLFKPMTMIALSAMVMLLLFTNCKKDSDSDVPYSNMDDETTESIKLTIPRIELSSTKSTKIKLYLSVTDQHGNPLSSFNKYNFEIMQVCTGDTDTTDVGSISLSELNNDGSNIAISTTLDYSGSMGSGDITNMEEAIKYFINLKEDHDYMEIIKFATEVQVVAEFTDNSTDLIYAVDNIPYEGYTKTAFYDAVDRGVVDADAFYLDNKGYLPAVLGFTDGDDNVSSISLNSVIDKCQLLQIPVYTIGFGDPNTYEMNKLADETGGRYYYTPDATELGDLYSLISGQLKNLYVAEWVYDDPSCDEVTIIVKSSYSCAGGDYVSFSTKHFYPL